MEAQGGITSTTERDQSIAASHHSEEDRASIEGDVALNSNMRLPELPTELWVRVFFYLDCHPQERVQVHTTEKETQPVPLTWEPWLVHRLVNRRFKAIIESLYASRLLRGSAVVVEGDGGVGGRQMSVGKPTSLTRYEFSGMCGGTDLGEQNDRFAVFRRKNDADGSFVVSSKTPLFFLVGFARSCHLYPTYLLRERY